MTLQNNSLNSLLKDNSRALKPYIIFKTCVCFNQKHPRSQRFTLHFSFCLFSKCTVMVYLLYSTEALIPQSPPFCISETRWFSHCHSTHQWEDFCSWPHHRQLWRFHESSLLKWGQKCLGWTKCHGRTYIAKGGVKVIRAFLRCHWTHLWLFWCIGYKSFGIGEDLWL